LNIYGCGKTEYRQAKKQISLKFTVYYYSISNIIIITNPWQFFQIQSGLRIELKDLRIMSI
jgi:hypothetical protein